MAVTSSVQPWTLTMPAGSEQTWGFKFTYLTTAGQSAPYPITANWEYVVRTAATDTGTPLIKLTTTASSNGVLVVTTTATLSQVSLYLYPAATAALTPQNYYHSLWMDPGLTTAVTWWSGLLIIDGNPQP